MTVEKRMPITVNGVSIDPASDREIAGSLPKGSSDRPSNYILVQSWGPLDKAQRAALGATGAETLEYLPENAYLCRFPSRDLQTIRALPFVAWAEAYLRVFKLTPRLSAWVNRTDAHSHDAPPPSGKVARRYCVVDVVVHRDVDSAVASLEIARTVELEPDSISVSGRRLSL